MTSQRVGCRHAILNKDDGGMCWACVRWVSALDVLIYRAMERNSTPYDPAQRILPMEAA